jgi:hypothetical protein
MAPAELGGFSLVIGVLLGRLRRLLLRLLGR